jgi:serine protease Do
MKYAILVGLLTVLPSFSQQQRVVPIGGSYIGVMMQEVDSERAKELKLREEGGVEITYVEKDGPADKAGMKVGDVVMRFNGQRVEGNEQFVRLVRETPVGRDVKLEINRSGSMLTLGVRVQRKTQKIESGEVAPMPAERWDIHFPDLPRTFMTLRSSALGVEAESIDGQLAQYFGVKEGVLIRSVFKGSAADKAGIKAGDVIMKIDDSRVSSASDISGQLRTLRGKSATVILMRDHKELSLTVAISNEDPSGRIQITPFQLP